MSPLPLLALLITVAAGVGVVYQSNLALHAQVVLKTVGDVPGRTHCALWCRRISSCVSWSYDPATLLCRLWPSPSASNTLTLAHEQVYQRKPPPGFVLSDNPNIAYTQHSFGGITGGISSLTALCQEDHPDAFPAFTSTDQQIAYIKQNSIGKYFYVGIYRDSSGVFRDMTTNTAVTMSAAWFWDGRLDTDITNNCLTLYYRGFWAVPCTDVREGYTCQYNTVAGTAPPSGYVISDDPSIAYRQHKADRVNDRDSFVSLCREHDPDSVPAFPSTEQQVTYIKQNVIGEYFYVGIYRDSGGVFRDMTTDVALQIPAEWFWNGVADADLTDDCLTLYMEGFWAVPCSGSREGYVCQLNL
ncbi:hypothetical protein FJT64_024749 [Amphibalanus amphitrite]|uniref:C-type lectin domain-containing protein n=1 Tax=Amphibalanus amphitrite TaxID=1232801 RepID=A0A6A4WHF9_AMPAM|nr:hypothetical protein FJT64_024749 [Amphibalanus amphitrite]